MPANRESELQSAARHAFLRAGVTEGPVKRMSNPYRGKPDYTFWRAGVTAAAGSGVDPVVRAPFAIGRDDRIATAGSCFAQHISRALCQRGFHFLVTEAFAPHPGVCDESYGVFTARFGNIYTTRQLVQLFDRAYGSFQPATDYWVGHGGEIIDPFRPRIQAAGFGSIDNLRQDRVRHLAAVRDMFETCDVFLFTLGLTEAWVSAEDGAVFPLAPGVVAPEVPADTCRFHNFGVAEVTADLAGLLDRLASVNPFARVILTVSPVPLIATYEDRHVLVSTVASKSILRAAVEEILGRQPQIAYFPSYEIVTGPQTRGQFYAADLREVTADGVSFVTGLFARHYLGEPASVAADFTDTLSPEDERRMAAIADIVCDEEAIAR
jgi:hypothetical protein